MNLPPAFGDDLEAMGQVDQSEGTTDGLNMFEKKRMERTHHVLEILWILFVLAMFSHTVPSKEEFRCEAIACCWFSSNLMKPYRYQIPLGFVQKLLITPKVVSFFGINEQIRPVLIEHPRVMSPLFPSVFFASLFCEQTNAVGLGRCWWASVWFCWPLVSWWWCPWSTRRSPFSHLADRGLRQGRRPRNCVV